MSAATRQSATDTASAATTPPQSRVGGTRARTSGLQLDFLAVLDDAEPSAAPTSGKGTRPAEVVPAKVARRRLGISKRKLATLIEAGVLHSPARDMVAIPRDRSLQQLFGDWARSAQHRHWSRAVELFVRARIACGARSHEVPPDRVLLACGAVLLMSGGTHRPDELAALLRVPAKTARAAAARLAMLVEGRGEAGAAALPGTPWTVGMIVAAFPALAGLRNTCLDPDPTDFFEEPGLRSRARLAATGPLAGPVSFFALVAAALARREERLEHHMLMLQRFAHLFARLNPGAGFDDAAAVAATLEHIAFSADLDDVLPPGVRDMMCRTWLMLTDVLERRACGVDPDGSQGLQALVPARHPEQSGFRRRLLDRFRSLRVEARERRKAKSDPLADTLSEKCARFWNRMEVVGTILEAARLAAADLLASAGTGAATHADFLVSIPVLDDNGRLVSGHPEGHEQEERWRVWIEDAFRASVGLPPRALSAQPNLPIGAPAHDVPDGAGPPDASRPRLVYERLGARAALGDRVTKPFLVTLSDVGALARPAGLDARTARRRLAILRTWNLPAPSHSPDGLLWFDAAGEENWRQAIARGRSIVPLEEFGMAMLFAELGLNAVVESMCRAGAFLQMEQSADGWPVDDTMPEHAAVNFAAIEKTAAGETPRFVMLPVLDQTFVDAMELAKAVALASGKTDGLLPSVLIEERYRWKRPHPRPYIFQWNGEALRLSHVSQFLRVLLANIADVTFHDFRHACAAELYELTNSPEHVQRALGQTSGVWRHYARQTARMRRRRQVARERERAAALADKQQQRRIAA